MNSDDLPGTTRSWTDRDCIRAATPHPSIFLLGFRLGSSTLVRGVVKRALMAVAGCLLITTQAVAQTELAGPVRDIARAAIVYPVVFDPLLIMPLTPGPQVVVDAHGADIEATVHAAIRNGDDSYGIIASVPLSSGSTTQEVDPSGLRRHASLGFHLTNIIWRPKAKAGLEEQLGAAGFMHLTDEERAAAARTIETTDAVSVPWVVFITADYRFNRAEYVFADSTTLVTRTDTRLNDTASVLTGVQLFNRPGDPGYFFGFSYTYSAVFAQFGGSASNGLPAEGPTKVRGSLLRVEIRRAWVAAHLGLDPSFAYEQNSGVKTLEGVGYWLPNGASGMAFGDVRGLNLGLRVGYQSDNNRQGGVFATVFIGSSFALRP
jgi:hypothetical protein